MTIHPAEQADQDYFLCLHSAPLDDVHVVLRTGVVAISTQGSPEVTPQPTSSSYHGGHDGPDEGTEDEELESGT